MRTDKDITIADKSEPKILSVLTAVLIPTLLSTGIYAMLFSAFKVSFKITAILIWAVISSVIFAVIHRINNKTVSVVAMAAPFVTLVFMALLNILNAKEGFQEFLYYLQNYVFYEFPGFYYEPDPDSVSFFVFVMLYNATPISIMTYLLMKRKFIFLSLLPFAPVFLLSVANIVMTPSQTSVVLTAAGIILLLFAHAFSGKKRKTSDKALLILAVPVYLFAFVITLAFPKENYTQDEIAKSILTDMKEMVLDISPSSDNFVLDLIDKALYGYSEQLPIDAISSNQLTALYASNKNLSNVGPFNPVEDKVMRVYKTINDSYAGDRNDIYSGNYLYLKVESLDTYKNNVLSRANNRIRPYDAEPDITADAQYSVLVTPFKYTDVDISPYYTDFYDMQGTGMSKINLFNITSEGDYFYASSPVPVKTGYVYTDSYLKHYVYTVALEVPERTRDAITMSGTMPDWYMECINGTSTMSDCDKVRAVTDFVSSLHPYDANTQYPPEGADFVPWFIIDAESGICVHYAVTTVILLRMIGIPARYVCGYVDNRSYLNSESIIYSSQAHAWFEFFVPEYGWIMGDSTPGYANSVSSFDINGVAKAYPEIEDAAFSYNRYNPDFDPNSLLKPTEQPEASATPAGTGAETSETSETTETTAATSAETTSSDPFTPASGTNATDMNASDPSQPSDMPGTTKPKIEFHIDPEVTKAVLSAALKITIAAVILFLLRAGYVMYWRIKFSVKTASAKIIAFYHYFRFLHRYLGKALPKQASFILEKVAFSNEKITAKDLTGFVSACLRSTSMLSRKLPWYKKAVFRLMQIKIRVADQK